MKRFALFKTEIFVVHMWAWFDYQPILPCQRKNSARGFGQFAVFIKLVIFLFKISTDSENLQITCTDPWSIP